VSGCELWLFQQTKYGNLYCTSCLDCIPHENGGILTRSPLQELWDHGRRSSLSLAMRMYPRVAGWKSSPAANAGNGRGQLKVRAPDVS
jgi:hypothetical protein